MSQASKTSETNPSRASSVLYLSMFVMGGCGLAYQYTLSKLASDLLGNSVQQWAIVIGVMMFFMGVGSDIQKHTSDGQLLEKFIGAELVLALVGAFSPILILKTYGSWPHGFALVQYGLIAVLGTLIGFEIPLLARINEKYVSDLKFNLGGILRMDYIGSLAGALLWVFVLPFFFSITQIPFALGALSLAAAALAMLFFVRQLERRAVVLWSFLISGVLLIFGATQVNDWTFHAEQKLYKERIIFSESSPYQRVVLTQSKTNDISLFINGNLQFNSFDEHIYHENLVHPAMSIAPQRKRVLILGGGDGLAAREVLKYPSVEELVLVDLDPLITTLARKNTHFRALNQDSLNHPHVTVIDNDALVDSGSTEMHIRNQNRRHGREFAPQGKVKILNLDAVRFLEQTSGFFDVIILDFPDPNSPELAKLYSLRFYELLSRRLTPGGLVIQQATSPIFAKEAFLVIGRTLHAAGLAALPISDTVPSFGRWGFWLAGHEQHYSSESLLSRIHGTSKIPVPTSYLTVDRMRANVAFGKAELVTPHEDITTTTSNRVYEYYIEGWNRNFF